MATILYIKADATLVGKSRTFKISDTFIEEYKKLHPEDKVTTLDLYKENIGFLPVGQLDEVHRVGPNADRNHPILKYAFQFVEADKYVVAAPFWNLSFPAILKAYLDYVTINGITFTYSATGPVGLCQGKKAVHFVSRGGIYNVEPNANFEMGDRYLRTLFGFLGIRDFTTIDANGLDVIGNDVDAIVNDAIARSVDLAATF
jgi:FMN-dependent NADH-azoreductase